MISVCLFEVAKAPRMGLVQGKSSEQECVPVAARSGLKAKAIPTLTNKAEGEGNVDTATTGVEVGRGGPGAVRASAN